MQQKQQHHCVPPRPLGLLLCLREWFKGHATFLALPSVLGFCCYLRLLHRWLRNKQQSCNEHPSIEKQHRASLYLNIDGTSGVARCRIPHNAQHQSWATTRTFLPWPKSKPKSRAECRQLAFRTPAWASCNVLPHQHQQHHVEIVGIFGQFERLPHRHRKFRGFVVVHVARNSLLQETLPKNLMRGS